jgi:hypothetical protein
MILRTLARWLNGQPVRPLLARQLHRQTHASGLQTHIHPPTLSPRRHQHGQWAEHKSQKQQYDPYRHKFISQAKACH